MGQGCPAHLVQPCVPAAKGEDEAQGEAMLGAADASQEVAHALCNEVKELQRSSWGDQMLPLTQHPGCRRQPRAPAPAWSPAEPLWCWAAQHQAPSAMACSYRFPLALHDVPWQVKDLLHHVGALVPITQEGHPQGPDMALAQFHHQQVALLYSGAEAVSGRDLPCGRSPRPSPYPVPGTLTHSWGGSREPETTTGAKGAGSWPLPLHWGRAEAAQGQLVDPITGWRLVQPCPAPAGPGPARHAGL